MTKRILPLLLALCVFTPPASAACVNRFVVRTQRPHQIVTLLTGKLTYQEAQDLAKAIASKQSGPIEWLDESGKSVAKQYGELKVVRPMPVGCDGRTSGVVIVVTFPTSVVPSKKMTVKIKDQVVAFEQQSE
ncbi:MAG TPA: hypothetical protein VF787_09795 [Thermoanaerobaculia bacterium]